MPRTSLAAAGSLLAIATTLTVAGCSKSAGGQPNAAPESSASPTERGDKIEKIAVPGGAMPAGESAGAPAAEGAPTAMSAALRLTPEEGQLSIEAPADARAGAEAIAKVVVRPGPNFKVNVEFPTKLSLQTPTGVTLAKAELIAGGLDKAKGDAERIDEKELTFAVKLTPAASGSYTINGSFKFAVCDKDQCLPKKEPISIEIAAK
ncbi:MAG: hypothetical protein ACTHU0_28080 [Kofleriaceae bacterium]